MAHHDPRDPMSILLDAGFEQQEAEAIVIATSEQPAQAQAAIEAGLTGAMVLIDAPDNLTIPPGVGGISQTTWDSISFWSTRGVAVRDLDGGRASIELDRSYLGMAALAEWCDNQAEVLHYDAWHEISDVNDPCPYSLQDPKETWAQWGLASNGGHAPIQLEPGGPWYRSNLYGDAGVRLPASRWYEYVADPQTVITSIIRILSVEEYLALPRPEPT